MPTSAHAAVPAKRIVQSVPHRGTRGPASGQASGAKGINRPAPKICACGGSCPRCLSASKRKGNRPLDAVVSTDTRLEAEARRRADQVSRLRTPGLTAGATAHAAQPRGRTASSGATASARSTGSAPRPLPATPAVKRRARTKARALASPELLRELGPGDPLDTDLRAEAEAWFDRDFEHVRLHTSSTAAELAAAYDANAFALGSHIVFNRAAFQPSTGRGRWLLAHELAHVVQQETSGVLSLQRDGPDVADPDLTADPAADPLAGQNSEITFEEVEIEGLPDEPRKYKWINYNLATRRNRVWFDALHLAGLNPFAPYDPEGTPNAFINRVAEWQAAADRAKLADVVFAAKGQSKDRQGSLSAIAEGVAIADELLPQGKAVAGDPLRSDGVIGPRTFWVMLAVAALAKAPKNRAILEKQGVKIDETDVLSDDTKPEWGVAWRAVHAYLFNPPVFRSSWGFAVRSDVAFQSFEELVGLDEGTRDFLVHLFFGGDLPGEVEITNDDLMAILARGYADQALEGVASLIEVDRDYVATTDFQHLLKKTRPKWDNSLDLRHGQVDRNGVNTLVENLSLQIPTDPKSQETYSRLQDQESTQAGTLSRSDTTGPLAALVVVIALPDSADPHFWTNIAESYVAEKIALEAAAEKATREHLEELQRKFEKRMAGKPDLTKDDAAAFVELLAGSAFTARQQEAVAFQKKAAQGYDVEITPKYHRSTAAAKANQFYALAEKEGYLIAQLSADPKSKFPLPLLLIQASRERASVNGKAPLPFDLIDTPHAAMHQYLPRRFSAREGKNGASQGIVHPYELEFDSTLGEVGQMVHDWGTWGQYATTYAPFEPVLVEIREFNQDAGQLVRLGRQIGGTDRIVLRYVWTVGASLPALNEKLWDAQGTVNLFGWIDAILTMGGLASVVAAPFIAAGGAGVAQLGAQAGQAAVRAAMRQALLSALRRFIITEGIGEFLGRATYMIDESEDVPEGVKTAWNGLMVGLLIYGVSATVKQGIKSFRNTGSAAFRAQVAAVEAELEAQTRAAGKARNAIEEAGEADVRRRTTENYKKVLGEETPPQSGPGRVRTDDPRATEAAPERTGPPSADLTLRGAVGDDAANTLRNTLSPTTLEQLAAVGDNAVIKKLVEAFSPDALTRILAAVTPETLARLGASLDGPALKALLEAFSGSALGVSLLNAFAKDASKLSQLLEKLGAQRLLALATDPGPARFHRLAALVDPAVIDDVLKNVGSSPRLSLDRFRSLINDVGPELAAEVMNTYTGKEIGARFRRKSQMSAAQNVARLAIQRKGEPTQARVRSGLPHTPAPSRPPQLAPGDFRAFHAVGPEATTPASVRTLIAQVQAASARAANILQDLIDRAIAGTLRDADIQALDPGARRTVQAFLDTPANDPLRHAFYGSALQYLAEAQLRLLNGGALPAGVRFRPSEYRSGKRLIPDATLELTLTSDLRYPNKNTSERAVIDWTTPSEAGKITKYVGGKPPVTYGVEIIQPGPPRVPATPPAPPPTVTPPSTVAPPVAPPTRPGDTTPPVVIPKIPQNNPDTDTATEPPDIFGLRQPTTLYF